MGLRLGLYEELSLTFPCEDIHPYGLVLVVPHSAFKGEWKPILESEGVQIYTNSYNGRVCFFLRKKNSNSQAQGVSEPQAPPSQPQKPELKPLKRFEWNEENIQLIQRLRAEGLGLRKISKRLAELGFKPPAHITISKKLKALQKTATREAEAEPKPQALNCEDSLFKELMEASQMLYPRFKKAVGILLKEASRLLMEG